MEMNETAANGPLFAYLRQQEFLLLKTFRKNGAAVATPVWFAYEDGKLYITTSTAAGKIKRIRNNGHVLLAPCDRSGNIVGKEIEGSARTLPPEKYEYAHALLAQKYGQLFQTISSMNSITAAERTYIEIEPDRGEAHNIG